MLKLVSFVLVFGFIAVAATESGQDFDVLIEDLSGKWKCKRLGKAYDKCLNGGFESSYGCQSKYRNETFVKLKACPKIEKLLEINDCDYDCNSSKPGWPTATLVYPPGGTLVVGEGRSCNITFDVQGHLHPFNMERRWYKDGVQINGTATMNIDESGGNLQTLKINAVTRQNEGRYWMIVRNDITREASRSPVVILKVAYLDDQFKQNGNQVVTVKEGHSAVLHCNPPAHFGVSPYFTWTESGQEITEHGITEYGKLVILQVGFRHQSSTYRCTITIHSLKEGYQTKQGPAVSLNVISDPASYIPPTIVVKPVDLEINAQIKSTLRMECIANGYPNIPRIRWYHNGHIITRSSEIYDIRNRNYIQISLAHLRGANVSGTYRCEASDSSTTETASAYLKVFTKPVITTGLPTLEVKKSSGSNLLLSCKATGSPVPSFRWYKNAQELSGDSKRISIQRDYLWISNLNMLDKGVYQCEAYNAQYGSISTGRVAVQERLTFVIRPEDVEVYLGMSATFNCLGKGDPAPRSLIWQFNGGTPPSQHHYTNSVASLATYKIPKVTGSDAGKISCIINSPDNLYPHDTATAVLTLRQGPGPKVRAVQKHLRMREGQDAYLVCLVENVQNSVTWNWMYKDTLITVPDDGRIKVSYGVVLIKSVSAEDEGIYTCQAEEDGLVNIDTIYLTVIKM